MPFVQGNNIGDIVGIFSLLQESFIKLFESIQHFFWRCLCLFPNPHFYGPFLPFLPLLLCMMLIWIHVSGEGKEEEKEERVLTCGGRETTNKRLWISPKNEHSSMGTLFKNKIFLEILSRVAWYNFGNCWILFPCLLLFPSFPYTDADLLSPIKVTLPLRKESYV